MLNFVSGEWEDSTESHKFWCSVFPFSFILTHWLFSSGLFSFHMFTHFLALIFNAFCGPLVFSSGLFSFYMFIYFLAFILFVSNFIPLWLEKILGVISVFLNLLRLVLCPILWSVLENILYTLEKNLYCTPVGWNVVCMCAKSI